MASRTQVAALPLRIDADGEVEVLLVTSRETRRWVIPKGWPWPGLDDHKAAAEEAREEAGVRGTAHPAAVGTFTYDKWHEHTVSEVVVTVFRLDVVEVLDKWPEWHQRQRAWFRPEDAAQLVEEEELGELIRRVAARLRPPSRKR